MAKKRKTKNAKSSEVNPDSPKPGKYLTTDQAEKLRQYARDEVEIDGKRDTKRLLLNQMIIEILLACRPALKAVEICRLRLRDLPTYHHANVILVRKNGEIVQAKEVTEEFCTKLKKYIKRCRKGAKPRSSLFASEEGYRLLYTRINHRGKFIKVKEHTARLSYRSLYSKLKFIGRKVNIPNLCPNMFLYLIASEAERQRQANNFYI